MDCLVDKQYQDDITMNLLCMVFSYDSYFGHAIAQ